ncbi:hypothetical protein NXH67_13665 [Butyrivibrio sp. DSM 10294]|nr:hypothetical protein [Butyrivibrio sp. DSM 10294]
MLDTEYNEAEVKELFVADGIRKTVAILRDLGHSDEEMLDAIIKQYDLKQEEAKKYL